MQKVMVLQYIYIYIYIYIENKYVQYDLCKSTGHTLEV